MRGVEMECEIRTAVIDDYSQVLTLYSQVQNMHVEWRPDIYKKNDHLISMDYFRQMVEDGNLYVAVSEKKVIGILEIKYYHEESPAHVTRDIIFIDSIAVDRDYRGQGVGHRFLDFLRELKEEEDLDGIELTVNAKNREAYEMYSNYGFTAQSINMELL